MDIVLYQSKEGEVILDVKFEQETAWLSQDQMANLFGVNRQAITKHLKNIFRTEELKEESTCSILEHVAKNKKNYKMKFYNLDAVISVGYRVNSTQATHFRIWATRVLKDHLLKGYTLHEGRLKEKGLQDLQSSIQLIHNVLTHNKLVDNIGAQALELVSSYARTWEILRAYDEDQLLLPKGKRRKPLRQGKLSYSEALKAIGELKTYVKGSNLFGNESAKGLQSILGNLEQTFGGEPLYKTIEEKAAHLLYFIIKDHPFNDGNKRIGCLLFLLYLRLHKKEISLNDSGLTALALLIAESSPDQKDLMIRLTVNLLIQENLNDKSRSSR